MIFEGSHEITRRPGSSSDIASWPSAMMKSWTSFCLVWPLPREVCCPTSRLSFSPRSPTRPSKLLLACQDNINNPGPLRTTKSEIFTQEKPFPCCFFFSVLPKHKHSWIVLRCAVLYWVMAKTALVADLWGFWVFERLRRQTHVEFLRVLGSQS